MPENKPHEKWLFLLSYAPGHRSGAGISVHSFAKYAITRGVKPTILTLNRKLKEPSFEAIDGVKIKRIPYFNHNKLTKIFSLFWIQFYHLKYCLRNQIIWITGGKIIGLEFMLLYSILFRRKIVFRSTMHQADDLQTILNENRLLRGIRKFLFSKIDLYYSLHPEFTSNFITIFKSGIPVIQSVQGVDLERFNTLQPAEKNNLRKRLHLPENQFLIVSLNVITKRKGLDEIIEILGKVNFDFYWVILGEKDFGKNHFLEHRMNESIDIQRKGKKILGEKIYFKEWVDNPEEYLAAADVFISGGLREGIPNACLQAMASGLPCLVKDNPGFREMLGKKEGAVLLYTNETEFLDHLLKLYSDLPYRRRIANLSRNYALDNFSYAKIFDEILSLLNQ
jgi:glycosyltransferase involved in cell wall biosynthesis